MRHSQVLGVFIVSGVLGVIAFWGFQTWGRKSAATSAIEIPVVQEQGAPENRLPAATQEALPAEVQKRTEKTAVPVEEVRRSSTLEGRTYEFKQTFEGVPVIPQGSLRIVSDEMGRVIREESNLTEKMRVTNRRALSLEEARRTIAGRIEGARAIVWTDRTDETGSEGRYAYEFSVDGYRKIVDAETGKLILSRDRRHH